MKTQTKPTTGNGPSQYLDEAAVAAIYDVSPATLRTWRCLGRGPRFLKIGRSVRYRPEDVHGWASEQARG
jgi:hypothetical protein